MVFVSDDVVLSDDSDGCEEKDEAARGDAPPAYTCIPSAPAGVHCALAEAPFADCESLSTPTVPVPVFVTNKQRALANAAALLASHKLTPHTILVKSSCASMSKLYYSRLVTRDIV